MNCRSVRGLFSPSLDAALSFEERRRLESHLKTCPSCQTEYSKLCRTVGWVRDLPQIAPDSGFVERVLAAARQSESRKEYAASEPGFWDRLRAGVAELGWSISPRVAIGAVALGLVVGVTGSMLVLRGPEQVGLGPTASNVEQVPTETPASGTPSVAGAPSETPVPGSISDLVDEMVRRMETDARASGDSSVTSDPDWTPTQGPGAGGRVVGTEPPASGQNQERGGRVYIVF